MKVARYIFLILLWSLLIAGIFWARNKAKDVICREIKVEVVNDDDLPFVTPKAIKEELAKNHITVINKPLWQINSDKIEAILSRSPYIEQAQCIIMPEGVLMVKVSQIVPVVRVFDGETSYYLNKDGKRMKANAIYHADVPIIHGHFTAKYPATRLLPLINHVNNDSVLNSLVTMYNVVDSNNIFLIPSIYGHVINFGDISNINNKFAKLQLFYKKVMPQRGWMTFDTISLKWGHQIVATRRVKKVETVIEYSPEDDEAEADMETITMGDINDDNGKKTADASDNKKENEVKKGNTDKKDSKDKKENKKEDKNNKPDKKK